MIDPDKLYFSSTEYRDLLEEIGDEIEEEDLAQRAQLKHVTTVSKYGTTF